MRTLLTPEVLSRPLQAEARPARQQGAALILSLVFLLLLTILGITAVSTSTLQEKMAGNMKDQNVSFQATETGLRGGETKLLSLASISIAASGLLPIPDSSGSSGVFSTGNVNAMNDTWWNTAGNTMEYGPTVGSPPDLPQVAADPRYAIEMAGFKKDSLDAPTTYKPNPGMTYYRIWSRGVGGTSTAQSALQSTFKIPGP